MVAAHPDDADFGSAGTHRRLGGRRHRRHAAALHPRRAGRVRRHAARGDAAAARAGAARRVGRARGHRRPVPRRPQRRLAGADLGAAAPDRPGAAPGPPAAGAVPVPAADAAAAAGVAPRPPRRRRGDGARGLPRLGEPVRLARAARRGPRAVEGHRALADGPPGELRRSSTSPTASTARSPRCGRTPRRPRTWATGWSRCCAAGTRATPPGPASPRAGSPRRSRCRASTERAHPSSGPAEPFARPARCRFKQRGRGTRCRDDQATTGLVPGLAVVLALAGCTPDVEPRATRPRPRAPRPPPRRRRRRLHADARRRRPAPRSSRTVTLAFAGDVHFEGGVGRLLDDGARPRAHGRRPPLGRRGRGQPRERPDHRRVAGREGARGRRQPLLVPQPAVGAGVPGPLRGRRGRRWPTTTAPTSAPPGCATAWRPRRTRRST